MTVNHTVVTRFCADCRQTYPYKDVHVCPAAETMPVPLLENVEDELLGTVLGERYRIESFLSRGGMGTVYVARHIVLDKAVAIKVLNEAKDEVAQKRFLLEAKAACAVNHEHIVNITDYGVLADDRPYLVMEFLQGQALDALVAKGPLSPLRVCRIGEQIALGLQAVHDKGILHRDLKPGNIYLLERHKRDYVKILDFGIAKVFGDGNMAEQSPGPAGVPPNRPTQEGMVLGTAEYLAPEQALGEPLDVRADQYALGCILYEMLTGEVPWKGTTAMATVVKRLNEDPQPPRLRRPELQIPAPLEVVTLRALSREREKRFASMNDVAVSLSQALELLGGATLESSASISSNAIGSLLDTQPRAGLSQSASASTLRPQLERPTLRSLTRPWLLPQRWQIGFAGVVLVVLVLGLTLILRIVSGPSGDKLPPGENIPLTPRVQAQLLPKPLEPGTHEEPREQAMAGSEPKLPPTADVEGEATRLVFENASPVEVTISCTHQRPCTMVAQKLCLFRIGGEAGRCEASAPGHKPQAYNFRDLRGKARGGRVRERVVLDAKGLGQIKL
jgi:serine/threonine protein kinase